MKILNVAALVAVTAAAALGSAQVRPTQGGPGGPGGRGPMSPQQMADMMVKRMTEELKLNASQQAKVKAIMVKWANDMKKAQDARTASLKKVLTPDQMKKMEGMRGMRGGMMGGRPGGRPGGGGAMMGGRPRGQ